MQTHPIAIVLNDGNMFVKGSIKRTKNSAARGRTSFSLHSHQRKKVRYGLRVVSFQLCKKFEARSLCLRLHLANILKSLPCIVRIFLYSASRSEKKQKKKTVSYPRNTIYPLIQNTYYALSCDFPPVLRFFFYLIKKGVMYDCTCGLTT